MTNEFILRLRSETDSMHKALEQNKYAKALMSDSVTIDDYASYLEKMYGFITVFEDKVQPVTDHLFAGVQLKSHLIAADLAYLKRSVSKAELVDTHAINLLNGSLANAIGALYVMEGSTLGGMVIYKHLHDKLGEVVENSASYFTVYGAATGGKWRSFIEKMIAIADSATTQQQVIDGAVNTFSLMNEWMHDRVAVPAAKLI